MELASKDYIINTVFRTNILPIISECNTACIFCSHRQNPEGIEVFRLPKLEMKDFEELLDFISPNKKIVIGEAATRITEGEPLLHKNFIEILELLRKRFPNTPIQVTTNGILLTEEMVEKMVEIGNVDLNISVNCINPDKRARILGLKNLGNIQKSISILKDKLKFSGSMVIVPEIIDRQDIEDVVSLLEDCGAESVRIFLQGYTYKSDIKRDFLDIHNEVMEYTKDIRQKYSIPIVVEPSMIGDLECTVEGIVKDSPACKAQIRTGDSIIEINGEKVKSRVEGFNMAFKSNNPVIKVKRDNQVFEVKLVKPRNTSPGFVVLYDIDFGAHEQIIRAVNRNDSRMKAMNEKGVENVLFITSELAVGILRKFLEQNDYDFNYKIISARNIYFGGTIKCAGLLTVEDIITAAEEFLKDNPKPDLIILPPVMFDFKKRDLLGRHLSEIESKLGIRTDTV